MRARVVGVRPREDGSFGVTLGPGPKIFWLLTRKPPNLGQLAVVKDASVRCLSVPGGSVTILEDGELTVEEDLYARRVVAPEWIKLVFDVMRRPLYPYQMEGAAWMASRLRQGKGSLLCDDPGLGKTTQVLAALVATKSLPAIIVSPTSVKGSWVNECKYIKHPLQVVTVNGTRGSIPSAHIVVTSYPLLQGRERQLRMLGAKSIVFDEAHLLKEPLPNKKHRAAVATRLSEGIPRVIQLTGTPVLNRPHEMWRLLHILDPKAWDSFPTFRARYCTAPGDKDGACGETIVTSHGKAKHIDELRALVMPYMLRRLKKDVLRDQLQPITRKQVLIELEPKDRATYDQVDKDVIAWLKRVVSDERAMKASKGIALAKLNMLRRIAAVGKMRSAFQSYLDRWFSSTGRPLVIFAYHVQILEAIRSFCLAKRIRTTWITGSDNQQKRNEAIDLFQSGKAEVFIGPLQAAGVGVNLQRGSDILFMERLWTPALMNQAESRCHRLGQRKEVTVTYIDAKRTVDEHIAKVLLAKQLVIDKVVDDQRPDDDEMTFETISEVIRQMGTSAA